ncbi:hypothetical protein HDU76_003044 [Blyttiomyces sp. JEL0837]|nr:hypothetical protein HDU76_003044 [Blyttiomyces sp. JEL0837]
MTSTFPARERQPSEKPLLSIRKPSVAPGTDVESGPSTPKLRDEEAAKPPSASGIKKFLKIPFFVLMFSYLTASVVIVGVIGWKFTYDSANNSLNNLASQIQARVSAEILNTIAGNADVITHVTSLQRNMFRTNKWSFQDVSRRNQTMYGMLSMLDEFRKWTVDIFLHPYPDGGLFGYYYPDDLSSKMLQMWEQYNHTLFDYLAAPDGTKIMQLWNWTDVNNDPVNTGINGTLEYQYQGGFGYGVNFSDYNYAKLGSIYPWRGVAYKTSVAVANNPVTKEVVLVGNDWTIDFLNDKFEEILSDIPYPMFLAAIETQSGRIISTSTKIKIITPDASILFFDGSNDTFLNDFSSWIHSNYPGPNATVEVSNLHKTINQTGPIIVNRFVNGSHFAARIELANVPWDLPWLSIQYLDMDSVSAPLRADSKITEITIFVIMGGVVIVGTLFAWVIARQIEMVVGQIVTLKAMKFQEVLEKEKGVKNSSFVKELSDLQTSFYEMVLAFASHLKVRSTITPGTTTGVASQSRGEYLSQPRTSVTQQHSSTPE